MRIIGGKYKRRVIQAPKNLPVRPTTDLARESLFNIISNKIDLDGKHALDLYAGTGAISYEFASRGCSQVIAVDQNYRCIGFIKQTVGDLGMDAITPIRSDAFRFIRMTSNKYDIVFADPPYNLENLDQISQEVFHNELVNPGGLLIVEHPKEVDMSAQPYFTDHRRYGHVNFSIFQFDIEEDEEEKQR